MRDKIKFKIWKLKNNEINKMFFYIKREFFKKEKIVKDTGNKLINICYELFKSLIYLLFISIVIMTLWKIEKTLYNDFFIKWEFIKSVVEFSTDYCYQFLIASLGISGVLIALFYANLSGVFSAKYVNLDTSLAFEILKDKDNKRNINSMKNYIITNIVLLIFYIVGIRFNYLIISFFIIYTVRIIIVFIDLSNRIFYFTNLNFITRNECIELCDNSKKVQVNKRYFNSKEFQNYYKNRANKNIEKLNKLIETFIKDKDYNAIYLFEDTIISALYSYMLNKNKIPYDSMWFDEKYKQKSMLKIGNIEIVSYVNTGVIPNPEKVKNTNWIEEELFKLIGTGLENLIKADKLGYAYEIIGKLDRVLANVQTSGHTSVIIKEELKLCEKINKSFNYNKENEFYIQAILEMEALFFMGVILKTDVYIKKCKNIIEKIKYKKINYNHLLKYNLKIFNNEKVRKVCEQLLLEKKIEGKVITGDRYIKEFLYALLYQEINDIENVYISILDYLKSEVEKMYKEQKYIATKIIIAKNIEIYNKVENSYIDIERIHKDIIKYKKDFIWIDELPKNFEDKLKDYKLNNIMVAIKLLGNLDFDKKEEDDSEFDIFGLVFYNAYLIANELLNNQDYERYKKIYKYLFALSNISDIKIKTELKPNGYNTEYIIGKYLKPYVYYMDIQGKMIYLSRVTKNSKWEDLLKEQVDSITKKEFFDTLIEYGNADKNRIEFDPFRDSMNRNFTNTILQNADIQDVGDIYGRKKIISDDEIVKKFKLDDYEFSEIFLCYYVNEKSENKYIAKYKWNEGND